MICGVDYDLAQTSERLAMVSIVDRAGRTRPMRRTLPAT
jgi:hypothetical protein